MNIFPTNLQYFITKKHFENKKEIILLYTDPNYSNEKLCGYYYPEKIIKEKIKINFLFDGAIKCGNIRLMKCIKKKKIYLGYHTFRNAAKYGNLENMKWLKVNGCPWGDWTFTWASKHGNLENMKWLLENGCPWGKLYICICRIIRRLGKHDFPFGK
jgi:hypothetical protein